MGRGSTAGASNRVDSGRETGCRSRDFDISWNRPRPSSSVRRGVAPSCRLPRAPTIGAPASTRRTRTEIAMTDEGEDIVGMLESLRRGDPQALAPVFSHYRDRLRRMVEFRLDDRLRGRVSTSDVLQEAY